ncbi:MAG: ATP-binding protein, partial [Bacteroidota bacterium]
AELAGLSDQIEKQKEDALRGQRILENQVELIAQRDREIKEREESLAEMSSVIDLQRNSLTLLVLFVVLLAVFLFFIFRAYKDRKKTARKLAVQRDELREQKEELSALLLELQQTQSQLVQSEKMASLGVLTAGIAHEINNAINFVYSGINILDTKFKEILPVMKRVGSLKEDDQNIQEKMKEIFAEKMKVEYDEAQELITQMIDYVQVGAKRTAEIVDGLRSFSRTNLEEKTESDLHKDLDVAILLLSSKLKDQIRIEKEYGENVPHVLAFQGQLGQAFLNVISNARDAAMEKGDDPCIKLATKVVDDHVSISISDNGVGMNQEDIDKIFDPFFTTKDIGVGTGLGLSITYGIIEKHGGKISVNTEKGKGSTFTIELPIRHEVEPVSEAS